MNYYSQHIGDYAKDAGHLSMTEDGAYRRLMDAYYGREEALPIDLKACYKLARATSKPEREAVQYVLAEFFTLEGDGWHQKRCDEEIERFQDKRNKARRSAHARWSTSKQNSGCDADAMRTHSEGNATRARPTHQSPVANIQEENGAAHTTGTLESCADQPSRSGVGVPAGIAAAALNRAGIRVTSMNPALIAATDEGITPEHLLAMAEQYPGKPAGYLIAAARREHAECAAPITRGGPKRGSVNADFSKVTYASGTPEYELPDFLRGSADNTAQSATETCGGHIAHAAPGGVP